MRRRLLLILSLIAAAAAPAAEPFRKNSIVLLQPMAIVERRADVNPLSEYILALQASAERFAATLQDKSSRNGFIVFATRPDKSVKVWLDFKPELPAEESLALISQLEAVPVCPVREGTVVVALNVSIWPQGDPLPAMAMPAPKEWLEAVKGQDSVEVTQLVDSIWPQKAGE